MKILTDNQYEELTEAFQKQKHRIEKVESELELFQDLLKDNKVEFIVGGDSDLPKEPVVLVDRYCISVEELPDMFKEK